MNQQTVRYKNKILTQLSSYLMASLLGTTAHYLVLLTLISLFSLQTVIASTCGAVVGALIIYYLNYFLVFKSVRAHRDALLRFLLVTCLSIFLNGAILNFLLTVLNWHYLSLQFITTILVFSSNFTLNRSWTFTPGRSLKKLSINPGEFMSSRLKNIKS